MITETNSTFSSETLNLAAGQKIAGCYLLKREMDGGGGHLIWIAQDEVLGKEVSLHFLPEVVDLDSVALDELRHEVKRNRPLIHPGVLRVYDLVEGDEMAAIAMETFDARCLAEILSEKKRFEVEDVASWLDQICVTLEEAHRIKLTHRDLAPENVFVTPDGRVLLANFGISRVVQDSLQRAAGGESTVARLHTLSPQLLEGVAPVATDDVYGVGSLFYELLAGVPVFSGGDVAGKILREIPTRLSDVRDEAKDPGKAIPPGWENVIAACLNKRSDERPQRPSEIVSSIGAYVPVVESPRAEAMAAVAPLTVEIPTEIELIPEEIVEEIHGEPLQVAIEEDAPETAVAPVVAEVLEEARPLDVKAEEVLPEIEAEPVMDTLAEPVPEVAADVVAEVVAEAVPEEVVAEAVPEVVEVTNPILSESAGISLEKELPSEPAVSEPIPPVPDTAEVVAEFTQKSYSPRPVSYYETEGDAFSSILPRRFRFPAAVAAAVVLLLVLINGFFKGSKTQPARSPSIAITDPGERSELTSVKNSLADPIQAEGTGSSNPVSAAEISEAPEPEAVRKPPAGSEQLFAAVAPTAAAAQGGGSSTSTLEKQISEKSAALVRLKEELAATDKAQEARLKEQQSAATALAEAQKAIAEKGKSVGAAKKLADELLAARKKREDDQQAAETAARAAQQLAAEKVRAAEDARKALSDFEAQNREKLAAKAKVEAEIKTMEGALSGHQKTAEESAKAAAAAEATRQKQLASIQQAEQEIAEAKAQISKASVEGERQRAAMDAERRKLDDEIAAMKALFEQKMKDIETRRQQIAGEPASPPVAPAKSVAPAPVEIKAVPVAAPAPTLPLMAMKTETPTVPPPADLSPTPVAAIATSAGANSLGMRFMPVGDVQFGVWQTRVKDFEAFAKAVNLKSTAWRGPGFRQSPDHPVVNVTWTEAIAFCKWLTEKEHKEGALPSSQFYRLPYDLEWSAAVGLPEESGKTPEARDMGVPDVYPWGTEWPPVKGAGNYTGEETGSDVAIKGYDDGFAWTAPVGTFPPNKFGLYDMGGNVWQWCMDSWNSESKAKVLRGASWYNGALKLSLLSSCRVHAAPDSSTDNYGFRVVRAASSVAAKSQRK